MVLMLLLASCERPGDPRPRDQAARPDASATAGAPLVRVFDAGREPRALTRFAFVPGRAETALLELESRLTRGSVALGEERVRLRLGVRYPAQDVVELTLLGGETTAPDIPRLTSTIGARFLQKVTSSGHSEPPEVTFPPGSDARAVEYVHGAVVQVASNLAPALPPEPIGEGARWAHNDLRFELVAWPGERLTVERRSEMRGSQRLATGEMVRVNEEQSYRIEAAPDGIARRVEAQLVAEQPGGATMATRLRFEVEGAPQDRPPAPPP